MSNNQKLRVGIIGAGEVAQVIHLPTLSLLSHLFTTTAVCDISKKNAEHCSVKYHIPLATTKPEEVYQSKNVDIVFILTSDEFHEPYTIAALQAGKHVMVEKPMTLSMKSAERIIEAESESNGRVFVGYMRRYATSFTQTFKREVSSIPRILYARVRDFSGPNAKFVSESGTFQVKNIDDIPQSSERADRLDALYKEVFPGSEVITPEHINYCRFLNSLGSHDISLMREVIGFPNSVAGVSVNEPFYSAIFNYQNQSGSKEPFSVTYESGIDGVPEFDAHIAIYGEHKRVEIRYDSPYVKGLPIKVKVWEMSDKGEMQKKEILGSYEDAYTSELLELYRCLVDGEEIKTTPKDAINDLRIFDMMYMRWAAEGVKNNVSGATHSRKA